MSEDLVLKSSCDRCGEKSNLYGSNCKHMTICLACGNFLAEAKAACSECGVPVTRLIREYNVRASNISNKSYSIGTFQNGLPDFSKKEGTADKWLMHKEGRKGPLLTDAMQEKYKNKPWIIEDETGREQYQGKLVGSQQGTYYMLMTHGKEFLAIPVDARYNFSKVAKYKQLSLEEAEKKMKNRRRTAEGFSRWMMKKENAGAAKDCEVKKLEGGEGRGRLKKGDDEADDNVLSDKGEDDEDEEEERKCRLQLNKKGGDDEEEEVRRGGSFGDDEEEEVRRGGRSGGDLDADDNDIEEGDDWEHEEDFTDDDEAVGSDTKDEDKSNSEIPAPREIKQDEDEGNEEEGQGLSPSGKEMKLLLERRSKLDNDNVDRDDSKSTETTTLRDEGMPGSQNVSTSGKHVLPTSDTATAAQETGTVTEEELLNFLRQMGPITTHQLSTKFRSRIKTQEDRYSFYDILKKISHFEKRNGVKYLVLRDI